jgi:hypothetical protein
MKTNTDFIVFAIRQAKEAEACVCRFLLIPINSAMVNSPEENFIRLKVAYRDYLISSINERSGALTARFSSRHSETTRQTA